MTRRCGTMFWNTIKSAAQASQIMMRVRIDFDMIALDKNHRRSQRRAESSTPTLASPARLRQSAVRKSGFLTESSAARNTHDQLGG